MLAHLEMTEAHGLPFAVMGFDPNKENVQPEPVRVMVIPLTTISAASGQDDALHRASKKYSSDN